MTSAGTSALVNLGTGSSALVNLEGSPDPLKNNNLPIVKYFKSVMQPLGPDTEHQQYIQIIE